MIDVSKFNKSNYGPGGMTPSIQPVSGPGQTPPTGGTPPGMPEPPDPYSTYTMPTQTFNAPGMDLWGQAADMYRQAGNPMTSPTAWGTAENAYNQMLGGQGNPVDVMGWWGAQQPVFQTQMSDYAKQAAEQAGMGGTRWSSPLLTNIADQTSRGLQNLTADFAGRNISAQEAARDRMMGSMSGLSNLGQGQANFGQQDAMNMMNAASGLGGIGTNQFNAPMQAAQAMGNMGNQLYNQQTGMMNQMYTPPWMQGAQNAAYMSAYGQPQTYQPSFGENMLGIAGTLLPYANFGQQPYQNPNNWINSITQGGYRT